MLKESVLFVGATGLLIFFMTPTDKSAEVKPVDPLPMMHGVMTMREKKTIRTLSSANR